MFSVCCPRHQRRVLLSPDDILSLSPAPDGGFVITYRCFCGYEGRSPAGEPEENCEESWKHRMAG
jgi:hypothetical protein